MISTIKEQAYKTRTRPQVRQEVPASPEINPQTDSFAGKILLQLIYQIAIKF